MVGIAFLFGSASIGRQAQVSGGCMGAITYTSGPVATRNVPDDWTAYGAPAKSVREDVFDSERESIF